MTEQIKKYSLIERIRYTVKRKWFCYRTVFGIRIPKIASDQDIFIDYAWRDAMAKKKRK